MNNIKATRNNIPGKRLYTVNEAAAYLGLKPRTIYNGKSNGTFPIASKKWGKLVLFDKRDLDSFIDSLPYDTR